MPITYDTYIGKQCIKKHIEKAVDEILSKNEILLSAFHGQVMSKANMSLHDYMLVTDQRVIFWSRGLVGGSTDSFHYSDISSVEEAKGLLLGEIVLNIRGTKERFRNMVKTDIPKAAKHIRDQISLDRNKGNIPMQAQESIPDKIKLQDFDVGNTENKCPKCDFEYENGVKECPRCGIIFSKYKITQTTKKVTSDKIIQPKVAKKGKNGNIYTKRLSKKDLIIAAITATVVFFIFTLIVANNDYSQENTNPGQLVTKNEFGEKWAFNVEEGYVYSIDKAAVFKAGGTEYQLNGVAKMKGYKPIDPIWRNNPDIPGTKINIGPFIELALINSK